MIGYADGNRRYQLLPQQRNLGDRLHDRHTCMQRRRLPLSACKCNIPYRRSAAAVVMTADVVGQLEVLETSLVVAAVVLAVVVGAAVVVVVAAVALAVVIVAVVDDAVADVHGPRTFVLAAVLVHILEVSQVMHVSMLRSDGHLATDR